MADLGSAEGEGGVMSQILLKEIFDDAFGVGWDADTVHGASLNALYDALTGGAVLHNWLGGKQGGTTAEYYHLTQAQHTIATQAATDSLSGYMTAVAQTFGGVKTFNALINTLGGIANSAAALLINDDAAQNVSLFGSAASGETPSLSVSGFFAADALRAVTQGITAADTYGFAGASKYAFDGKILVNDPSNSTGGINIQQTVNAIQYGITLNDFGKYRKAYIFYGASRVLNIWDGVSGAGDIAIGGTAAVNVGIGYSGAQVLAGTGTLMVNGSVLIKHLAGSGETPPLSIFGYPAGESLQQVSLYHDGTRNGVFLFDGVTDVDLFAFNKPVAIGGGGAPLANEGDLVLQTDGVLALAETTTPTADADYAKLYAKADNLLYYQDGAGAEHVLGDVSAGANMTDDFIVRGDGGAKGVQTSLVKISDAGDIIVPGDTGIYPNTADASDNKHVTLAGGGARNITRGGFVIVYGNESGGTGSVQLQAGDVVGGIIQLLTAGVPRMTINRDGTITVAGVTTLPNTSALATSAAPTADAQIANMKYVVDYVAAAGGCSIAVGTFTGDGSTDQAVDTGLGKQLLAVEIIKRPTDSTTQELFFKYEDSWTTYAYSTYSSGGAGPTTVGIDDRIIALDADGEFHVDDAGLDYAPNTNGVVYSYRAFA